VATGIDAEAQGEAGAERGAERPKAVPLSLIVSRSLEDEPARQKAPQEPAQGCQVADAETAIEPHAQNQPAEDRPEDEQPANNKTVAAAPFTGDGAKSEEAGVRYIVWDRKLETRIYKIPTIQIARVRNEPHVEKLKVFASLEEAKTAAGAILSRIIYEQEANGRSTNSTKERRVNLMCETEIELPNYFVL
jgi:hypothetical protein